MKSWQPEHKLLCRSMDNRVINRVRECSHVKCLKIYVATSWLTESDETLGDVVEISDGFEKCDVHCHN